MAGRPFSKKYIRIIQYLKDETVYSPATIAQLGEEKGLLRDSPDLIKAKNALRKSLSGLAKRREFPIPGDGTVKLKQQGTAFGWFGWRWKKAVLV